MKQNRKMRILTTIALVIFTIALALPLLPSSTAQAVDEPWPQFGQNPANHRAATGSAPKNLGVKWTFKTDALIFTSAALAYGNVYFGGLDQNIYCLDAQTGTLKWKFATGWRLRASPAVSNGKVYTGDDDGYFYCLDANSGSQIWKTLGSGAPNLKQMSPGGTVFNPRSSPNIAGGKVYVGSMDSNVYCLNANTGAVVWKFKTGSSIASSPAVANGKVYIGSGDALFYCLNATSGAKIWSSDKSKSRTDKNFPNTQINSIPTVIGNKVIYFSLAGAWLCQDANTGADIWEYHTSRARAYMRPDFYNVTAPFKHPNPPEWSGVSVNAAVLECPSYHDGVIHVNEDFWMLTLNVTDGSSIYNPWPNGNFNYDLFTGFVSYPSTAYAPGSKTIYTASAIKSVYCNDAFAPKRFSWYETEGQIHSSPSVAYGNLYIGSNDWSIYCFDNSGPVRDASNPASFKTNMALTAQLSAQTVEINKPITIIGTLSPAPSVNIVRGGAEFMLNFTKPDGTLMNRIAMYTKDQWGYYQGDGSYKYDFTPDMEGTWTVFVQYKPGIYEPYNKANSERLSFTVTAQSLPSPATAAAAGGIIASVPDIFVYGFIGIIAIIAVLTILVIWHTRRK